MEIEIVKMTFEHLPVILEIEKELFSEPWLEEYFKFEIEQGDSLTAFHKETGEIVGYICGWAVLDEFSITNVGVAKRFQKQGIAERMLELLLSRKVSEGVVVFYLEVRESNLPAINLYRKTGFTTIGKRLKYYRNPVEDAIVMKYTHLPE
ncbi:MAG: ribosomal protein S18-alanine N-acetyltransferase [Candidatus Cloacimonetes bacterium]|nr:ribosomal protein S18-alanine N-acetyltransferase [Candidatus Cloacimonadota bacterium]